MPRGKPLGSNVKKLNYTIVFNSNDDKDVIDFLEGQRDKSSLIRGLIRDYVNSGELQKPKDDVEANKKKYYSFALDDKKDKDIIDALEGYKYKSDALKEIIRDSIEQGNLPQKGDDKKAAKKKKSYGFSLNDEDDEDLIEFFDGYKAKSALVNKLIREYMAELSKKD